MTRSRSSVAALAPALFLALAGLLGSARAASAEVHGGPGLQTDAGSSDGFGALFVLVLISGVGITIWKVSTARRMARDSGMDPDDATTMALLTDDGFEATYLASNLRGRTAPPIAPPPSAATTTPAATTPSVAERLRQLQELRDQGLITPGEHDARRTAIIDSV